MHSGQLDRQIILQQRSVTRDAFGAEIVTYATFATVWAQKVEMSGREFFTAKQVTPEVVRKYRIRWLAGVNESMRLVDGETWDIQRITEIDRRKWLEITVKVPTNG